MRKPDMQIFGDRLMEFIWHYDSCPLQHYTITLPRAQIEEAGGSPTARSRLFSDLFRLVLRFAVGSVVGVWWKRTGIGGGRGEWKGCLLPTTPYTLVWRGWG